MASEEDKLKALKQDYKLTFATKEGEAVIADLKSAYYHRGSYSKNDPHETSYREGQRSVIIRIITELMKDKNV